MEDWEGKTVFRGEYRKLVVSYLPVRGEGGGHANNKKPYGGIR